MVNIIGNANFIIPVWKSPDTNKEISKCLESVTMYSHPERGVSNAIVEMLPGTEP